MNIIESGIFLWLAIFTYGEDVIKSTEFERTFFEFDTIEQCVQYGDTSEFIQNTVRNNPGKDWLFALCLDPRTGGRGYILPVYNATEENPSGRTPYEMQKIILDFEDKILFFKSSMLSILPHFLFKVYEDKSISVFVTKSATKEQKKSRTKAENKSRKTTEK